MPKRDRCLGPPEDNSRDVALLLTVGSSLLTAELLCLQVCLGAFILTV